MGHGATSSREGIAELERRVAALGDAVVRLTSDAGAVFSRGEGANAGLVAENRDRICSVATECADFALARIARRQPSMAELRAIAAALAISDEYRRIADLAADIARHSQLARLLPEIARTRKGILRSAEDRARSAQKRRSGAAKPRRTPLSLRVGRGSRR